jgi:hypothetical protein
MFGETSPKLIRYIARYRTPALVQSFEVGVRSTVIYWSLGINREQGSSVSIVPGYGLDDRAIEVRSPAEAKGFFLHPLCPDRLWGPPSFLYNGYRRPFPGGGGKARPVPDPDHSPHLLPNSRTTRWYTASPLKPFMACSGTALVSF